MVAFAWVLGLFGVLALLLATVRLAAGCRVAAAGNAMLGTLLIGAAAAVAVLAADLGSYARRVDGRPVADLFFEQVGTERFRVTLTHLPGGRMQVFELAGEAWRLDARTLDFGGWARAAGLRPVYRLDRLVAVGGAVEDPATGPATGFVLGTRGGADLWQSARDSGRWRELVSAAYARSDELPMTDRSRFELLIAGQRIEVRPANAVAEAAAGSTADTAPTAATATRPAS